jgi:ATP-dependent protease Clp ATPase subunit
MTNSGLICSFCGKEPEEVIALVNAASVSAKGHQTAGAICNECVELCVEIIGLSKPDWLERHRQLVATLGK